VPKRIRSWYFRKNPLQVQAVHAGQELGHRDRPALAVRVVDVVVDVDGGKGRAGDLVLRDQEHGPRLEVAEREVLVRGRRGGWRGDRGAEGREEGGAREEREGARDHGRPPTVGDAPPF
jgi:hypothetical protein